MSRLGEARREGAPNAFGAQRFGARGDNAARALAWLRGTERPPRDARMKALLFSALQAHVFNEVLRRRVADGTWNRALQGDVLKKTDTGGLFVCTDVQTDAARSIAGEVSPTGPMFGAKMTEPESAVRALEEEVISRELSGADVTKARALGQGTRRALRIFAKDLEVQPEEEGCVASFVLPKGAFATTVLEHLFRTEFSRTEEEEEG